MIQINPQTTNNIGINLYSDEFGFNQILRRNGNISQVSFRSGANPGDRSNTFEI